MLEKLNFRKISEGASKNKSFKISRMEIDRRHLCLSIPKTWISFKRRSNYLQSFQYIEFYLKHFFHNVNIFFF